MKKYIVTTSAMLFCLILLACGKATEYAIPDVFGIDYNDAKNVLEADGFTVTAIETDVHGIAEKLLYELEFVGKGKVFKIDDYILDNHGSLTKNYDILYFDDAKLVSSDKSVVIYYAKDDYFYSEEEPINQETISATETETIPADTMPVTTTPSETETPTQETEDTVPSTEEAQTTTSLSAEFKAAMDSYEAFMDQYVAFMKKYNENPSDLSLAYDYLNYMSEYLDFMEEFSEWGAKDLNAAETAYYIEVQTRVTAKLLEVA